MKPNDAQMRPNWSLELQVGVPGSKATLSEFVLAEIFLRKTEASINVKTNTIYFSCDFSL